MAAPTETQQAILADLDESIDAASAQIEILETKIANSQERLTESQARLSALESDKQKVQQAFGVEPAWNASGGGNQ